MPLGADDHMIVQRDVEPLRRIGDAAGELDISAAGGGVAAGVVVDQPRRMR